MVYHNHIYDIYHVIIIILYMAYHIHIYVWYISYLS